MPKINTERDAKIIALRNQGMQAKEIAILIGMNVKSVQTVVTKGVKNGTCTVFRDFEAYAKRDEEIAKLHNEGMADVDLAAKYGLTNGGLSCLLSKLRVKGMIQSEVQKKPPIDKKERNDRIVKMYVDDKLSMQKIADILGMEYRAVHYVLDGRVSKELRQNRLKDTKIPAVNADRNAAIIRLFNEGKSLLDIVDALSLSSKGVAAGVIHYGRKKGLVTRAPETQNAKNCRKKPKRAPRPITARQAKARPFADALPDKEVVKAEQLRNRPLKAIVQVKSNLTNLPLREMPKQPASYPSAKTKTKLADGIRADLPPKCKYELHNITQSMKLPRKNPEYIWCPNDIVKGNYCKEHYNLCYQARGKKYY